MTRAPQRHLKIAVPDFVYWGVTALASERGVAASAMFAELAAEALAMRAQGGRTELPAEIDEEELLLMAGLEGETFEVFINRLISLGREAYCDDRMVAAEPWVGE